MKKNITICILLLFSLAAISIGCLQLKTIIPIKRAKTIYLSTYTGEEVENSVLSKIPFMAIVENSKDARPQSGLQQADIIYETMAEGGIPRFIALFQKYSPAKIGPIRSVRPYFIDITKEYGLPFAHCGGSEDALDIIKKETLMSLNEISNGKYFWRDNSRKAPHNLYTSAEKLRTLINEKKYVKPSIPTIKFTSNNNNNYWDSANFSSCTYVEIKPNKLYSTSYQYKNGYYYKSMDSAISTDRETKKQLFCSNIVIQLTKIITQSDGLHLTIPVIGQGNCYVITNGKYIIGKWSRDSVNSITTIKDVSGKEIPLSPGKTWWHIVDKSTSIIVK